jgi:hypothetical protein
LDKRNWLRITPTAWFGSKGIFFVVFASTSEIIERGCCQKKKKKKIWEN